MWDLLGLFLDEKISKYRTKMGLFRTIWDCFETIPNSPKTVLRLFRE